ncbi:dTDP-glucose 4,6-dehydratase [Rubripirellula lacrimiformis]|uniref:dTDP-glucose 4,6-dehydratase n=1 Tax=Rubripirellula lacrimiformis TaxID=1930273 RepID=A0A517N8N9_9BACT|nr:NAD-dependent 4,6-dehydratase LegB [Rubripirellula lacrimiformis]QDT03507.1 dTDP-glucose 4,6-dehydratase [Rubripirellula lacrimiformis]
MKILVTGADGFIGSHLTELLVQRGYDVRALAAYNSFNSWGWLDSIPEQTKSSIEVVSGDIRDATFVRHAVRGTEAVLHLAALIAIPYSYQAPGSYVDTNIHGTLNVLEAARDFDVAKVLHTSTSEVYGTADYVPIDEEHPLKGQSPYSASKIGADQLALSYFRSFDTPVTVVRPFNTYGPRQSARAVIPTVIAQVAAGATKLKMGDLTPTRDFNYVADTAAGFEAILRSENTNGEVINLGTGYEISVADTLAMICELMSVEVEIEQEQQRIRPEKSEVFRLCADASKAAKLTDWVPQYGDNDGLRRGLKQTIDWFRDASNLKLYKAGTYNV